MRAFLTIAAIIFITATVLAFPETEFPKNNDVIDTCENILGGCSSAVLSAKVVLTAEEHPAGSPGMAAVGRIENGKFVQTDLKSGLSTWSMIIPVSNHLFFYNTSGDAAVGHIKNGKFVQTYSKRGFSTWTTIIPIGNHLFFYNTSGDAAVGRIK